MAYRRCQRCFERQATEHHTYGNGYQVISKWLCDHCSHANFGDTLSSCPVCQDLFQKQLAKQLAARNNC